HKGCEGSWWNLYTVFMNSGDIENPHKWASTFTRDENDAKFLASSKQNVTNLITTYEKIKGASINFQNAMGEATKLDLEGASFNTKISFQTDVYIPAWHALEEAINFNPEI